MIFKGNKDFLSKLAGGAPIGAGLDNPVHEHLHCRSEGKAALFDMSFLVQMRWRGRDRVEFLERILVGDIASLEAGNGILSVMTNAAGGIIDDAIITNVGDHLVMTIHDRYEEHFKEQMELFDGEVDMEYFQHSILAVQGPGAPAVMAKLLPPDFDMEHMAFMSSRETLLHGSNEACRIARCGFTGEDGFEIHIPTVKTAVALASNILEDPNVLPAGLKALNTLRLEAGLCAKGKELGETVNPVEAGLGWTIARRRRQEGGFLGAESLLTSDGKLQKVMRKCVGIMCPTHVPEDRTEIFDATGCVRIGEVTSGVFSPCLKTPIAMAYIEKALSKAGTNVLLKTAGGDGNEHKIHIAQVVKMPFVETRFYQIPDLIKETHTGGHPEHEDAGSLKTVRDPATGEVFESCSFVTKIRNQYRDDAGPLMTVRDPATGEVFKSLRAYAA